MDLDKLIVYRGGTLVPYAETKVGILAHGLNYGTGCFEGIRGYWNAKANQLYFFRLLEHYERLADSAKLLMMELTESPERLCARTAELARANNFRQDLYVRPLVYKSAEEIGVRLHKVSHEFTITAVPHKAYFDSSAGLRACISSWRRIDDNVAPARAKLTGVYVNSALAKTEAVSNGFDEAIMLNSEGHVAEGSAQNIFIVRNGIAITPPVSDGILEGITRRTIIDLCQRELNIEVLERSIDRSELYVADEVFLVGTAVEVAPVIEVDHRPVGRGKVGTKTAALRELYRKAVMGELPGYRHWLTPAYDTGAAKLHQTEKAAAS
ncbi:MAG TPA: branched-chain amino acid transaminase [Candidatus Eremiobacteraceae bacterium]|nr:branched-chain amino acid transaminase [Candidatus Eremiobacteraceae bacterium]